ncbi:hypothetical protein JMG10_48140, partial [Nostoc ellipsosporum NOK]|nr:hypothetical protein [Nostoc ellipsosporum NOK]
DKLIDSLVIASGTFHLYNNRAYADIEVGCDYDEMRAKLYAKKLVSANENCLVEALTEIVKSQYNL